MREKESMDTKEKPRYAGRINWKWVGVSYCFFVVFHLLPSYLLLEFAREGLGTGLIRSFWILAGLLVIGLYIGHRSRGVTILEPAIAAVLYTLTLFLNAEDTWGKSLTWRSLGILFIFSIIAFLTALCGAWIGELLQARREKAPT
jgi:hypothetical protein